MLHVNNSDDPPELLKVEEQLVPYIANTKDAVPILDVDWIYFIDSGGQPQFHQLLPAFMHHTNLNIFVLRLCDKLSDHPTVQYYDEGGTCIYSTPSLLTNKEILQRCAQATQTVDQDRVSKLLIVGTHRDLEDQCHGETRDDKNEKLLELLTPSMEDHLMYFTADGTELIYPLNVKDPSEDDRKLTNELCQAIGSMKDLLDPQKIPLRWLVFHQEIQALSKKTNGVVLSLQECSQVAIRLHMVEDTKAALMFFSDLNVILYYPSILPDVVFTNPQCILDIISEIVKCVAFDRKRHFNSMLVRANHEGIISEKLLEYLHSESPKVYSKGIIEPKDLIGLMVHLGIASKCENGDEYFMPTLLNTLHPQGVQDILSECSDPIAPIALCHEKGYFKCGSFNFVITSLLSSKQWTLAKKRNKLLCVYLNCITMSFNKSCNVTLIDNTSYIEIHLDGHAAVLREMCPEIKRKASLKQKTVVCSKDELRSFHLSEYGTNVEIWFQEDAEKRYDEAMKLGSVKLSIIKCLVLGIAGVGKTHLKRLLLSENTNVTEGRVSTGLVDNPIQACVGSVESSIAGVDENDKWTVLDEEMLWTILAKAYNIEKPAKPTDVVDVNASPQQKLLPHSICEKHMELKAPVKSVIESGISEARIISSSPFVADLSVVPSESKPYSKPGAKKSDRQHIKAFVNVTRKIVNVKLIHFIDSGGQPQFLELLPAFVQDVSAILFAVNLSEPLDHCPMISLYGKDCQPVGEPIMSPYSHKQMLEQCLRVAHATNKCPLVFVVGTHRDKESECSERIGDKSEMIKRVSHETNSRRLVLKEATEVIWSINGKSPDSQDQEVAGRLRQAIAAQCQVSTHSLPIKWFRLESLIQKAAVRGVISFNNCLHEASSLDMNEEDLQAALLHMAKYNLLLWFHEIDDFKEVIFCDPQVILNIITDLVQFKYELIGSKLKMVVSLVTLCVLCPHSASRTFSATEVSPADTSHPPFPQDHCQIFFTPATATTEVSTLLSGTLTSLNKSKLLATWKFDPLPWVKPSTSLARKCSSVLQLKRRQQSSSNCFSVERHVLMCQRRSPVV
ncbi:hypothetical protein EMCRGX_G016282 [Ephydatia muelleri]